MAAPDFLADKRKEIHDRLKDLKPAVDEYHRLEAAAHVLAELPAPTNGRRRPGRPSGSGAAKPPAAKARATAVKAAKSSKAKAGRGRSGRRKGTGRRAAEALALITAQPGITIPELATNMSMSKTYLYKVLPGLKDEQKVTQKGRGWHPAAATS